MPALELVPIRDIALHIQQCSWVDIRVVDVGTFERVRIESLLISVDHDKLMVMQKHPNPDDSISTTRHEVNCDDIRWVRPTRIDIEAVKPIRDYVVPGEAQNVAQQKRVVAQIKLSIQGIACIGWEEILMSRDRSREVNGLLFWRRVAMAVFFEMTSLDQYEIAQTLGYRSTMPVSTLPREIERSTQMQSQIAAVGQSVDAALLWRSRRQIDLERPWPRCIRTTSGLI